MQVCCVAIFIALTITEETADYLLELMNDQNKEVSRTCNKALDIIMVGG